MKKAETRHNAVLVLYLILIIALMISFSIIISSKTYEKTMYVDGEKATAYNNSNSALKSANFEISDETEISFSNTNKLHDITVVISGQDSGIQIKSSTEDLIQVGNLKTEDYTFSFNANNLFFENELLLIRIDYSGSRVTGSGPVTTKYYSVIVGQSSNPELTDEAYATSTSDGDLTAEVRLNNVIPAAYANAEAAIETPTSVTPEIDLSISPGENLRKIEITFYQLDGTRIEEVSMYASKGWQEKVDFTNYIGETLLLKMELESDDFAPAWITRYSAVTIS